MIPAVVKSRPSNGIAAVLSLFIPGAGQMYKGKTGQGLLWLLATVIGYMMIVPGLIVHVVCIFNAAVADSADQSEATKLPTSSDEIRWRALDDKKPVWPLKLVVHSLEVAQAGFEV